LTMTGYSYWLIPPALMILALIPTFYFLLKRPTLKGRRLMDELEGFKDYLSVAEKDRLKFHNPPEKTPELFEKYVPYAIALKVEDMWGSQFEDVLANAAREAGRDGYSPAWYSGGGRRFRTTSFTSSLSSGFTSAISSASQAPSSGGSGFSGGFSGGGGGGGGGGGW
ncbi:MAG: hypothetical protein V3R73_01115, partial [Sphingomonadales bacterium]